LSPQRGNPTRRTPNVCLSSLLSRAPAARPSPLGRCRVHGAPHAAARAWREGLCVSRTRPHALCVPHPFAFLFERLSPPFEAIHFLNPFGRRGLLSFPTMRRFSRTRREDLCVTCITPFASFRFSFRAPFTCHFLNPF